MVQWYQYSKIKIFLPGLHVFLNVIMGIINKFCDSLVTDHRVLLFNINILQSTFFSFPEKINCCQQTKTHIEKTLKHTNCTIFF